MEGGGEVADLRYDTDDGGADVHTAPGGPITIKERKGGCPYRMRGRCCGCYCVFSFLHKRR